MSVFILQLIIVTLTTKHIKRRSHIPSDVRKTNLEKYIGIVANILWFGALVYSIFLPLHFGTIWFYIGFSGYIFGVWLLLVATINFMNTPGDQLIKEGVYKFSRHPMYLATFLICLGSGIAAASGIFIVLSIFLALCLRYEALLEEKYCTHLYEDQYIEYKNKVPRWLGLPK
jgi:protein-S-isoprenylcysteine O-methyltransferase Ste14